MVHDFADPADPRELGGAPAAALLAAVEAAARRGWDTQTVLMVEAGRVWGDDELHDEHRDALTDHLVDHGVAELVVVPIGAGPEALGMFVLARSVGGARWTESESWAALGIGHDLGRALLGTRRPRAGAGADGRAAAAGRLPRRADPHGLPRAQEPARRDRRPRRDARVDAGPARLEAEPSLRALGRSSSRLTGVVDDLLLLSRIGNPDTPLDRHPVDLAPILRGVLEDETVHARHAGVELLPRRRTTATLVVPETPRSCCDWSPTSSTTPSSTPPPAAGSRTELERTGDTVVFTCRDDGLGISGPDRQRLFNEFFRSTNPEALARPGTGLGLAIVARIASRHGGRIDVESTLGVGHHVPRHPPGGVTLRRLAASRPCWRPLALAAGCTAEPTPSGTDQPSQSADDVRRRPRTAGADRSPREPTSARRGPPGPASLDGTLPVAAYGRGSTPPPWLFQRLLPETPDGFGEVRPTPPVLRRRAFTLPDQLPRCRVAATPPGSSHRHRPT